MKKSNFKSLNLLWIICLAAFVLCSCSSGSSTDFEYGTLRMDYLHSGTKDTSVIEFLSWKAELYWGGPRVNLIADPIKGDYIIEVFEAATGVLLYANGYSSLFREWQTTEEAENGSRTFYESIIIPFPKKKVRIRLSERDKQQQFHVLFETLFDPFQSLLDRSDPPAYWVEKIRDVGNTSENIDLVFLPEGYTVDEMEKFRQDVARVIEGMFSWSPYDEYKDRINVWIVEAPSEESGTDIPQEEIWKNTILNTSFNTFNIERYLTTTDYKAVRDLASCAPYDQICILVNHADYGGCGIYNFYTLFTSDNTWTEFLFMHEFGHGFVALADEYYEPEVTYTGFFDLTVEPYQENITTLVDFGSKWQDMMDPATPIPTPDDPIYHNTIGVFEGAGYQAEGLYRPFYDCTMKSVSIDNFCPVCQRAIRRAIESNTD